MEYLFRGFTTEKGEQKIIVNGKEYQGEWVYGYYFCLHHMDNRMHIHHFIIPENISIPKERPIGEIQIEVIPETVGQFTGLTDKNGKKIFAGDRIFWNSQYGVVKFGDYETSDGHKKLGFYIDWDFLCWLSESIVIATKHEPCEVIGNIHEEAQ